MKKYPSERFDSGDTGKELPTGSHYLLYKSGENRTNSQCIRAKVLFEQYSDMENAYSLSHSLRMIFNRHSVKDSARLNRV